MKLYVGNTPQMHLGKVLLMSTNNIYVFWKIKEHIYQEITCLELCCIQRVLKIIANSKDTNQCIHTVCS